jgi:hypothetical protein
MGKHLNALEASGRRFWTLPSVQPRIGEQRFDVTIGGDRWVTKLGGTMILYFLISYHYALFSLTRHASCNYPGLLIMDLPATLADGTKIRDSENYIIEPFIDMISKQPEMANTQMIVTGSAFGGLAGANKIELTKVWK